MPHLSLTSRSTIRHLLRLTLLALVGVVVWNSYFPSTSPPSSSSHSESSVHSSGRYLYGGPPEGGEGAEERGNALVVASLKGEDTGWLDRVENVRGWERVVYVVNDGSAQLGKGKGKGEYRVPRNKGREGMVYLSLRYQWHNDDPMYDGIPILQNLQVSHIHEEGYANLRCCWTLGCPAEIHPNKEYEVGDKESETQYRAAFMELFPDMPLPEVVGVGCCAQFAVTKARIRTRPVDDYIHYRDWLLKTDLADDTSGRIMEYSWHMIFGKEPVHCPPAKECYCKTFGYCNLTCTERACEGRYTLPPYSTMPEGWPEKGWT